MRNNKKIWKLYIATPTIKIKTTNNSLKKLINGINILLANSTGTVVTFLSISNEFTSLKKLTSLL